MFGLVLGATLLLTAGDFDLNGTVTSEIRAGEAPLQAGSSSTPSLVGILTPAVGVEYLGPRLTLDLDYGLRIFLREAQDEANSTLIYLNTWTLTASSRPTPRLTLTGAAQVSEGAADYSYLPSVYGVNQATLVSVPHFLSLAASIKAEEALSRTVKFDLPIKAMRIRPVGESTSMSADAPSPLNTVPRYTLVAAQPDLGFQVTETDQLILATLVQYQYIADLFPNLAVDPNANPLATHTLTGLTISPTVGWRSRLTHQSTVTTSAGVAYNHLWSSFPVQRDSFAPVGSVLLDHRLVSQREIVAVALFGLAVDYYVDPFLGEPVSHGTATGGVQLSLADEWTLGLRANFVSSFEAHPVGIGATLTYPDEVAASVVLPARHRVSDNLYFEIGARWSDRSPFFDTGHFGFHQREAWLYALLTLTSRRVAPYGAPP
jgi:hypothetical protein